MAEHAWFGDSLRKIHVLYVSPEWAARRGREFDAEELVGTLADRGIDCIELYCKDHHGNVYYPSAHGIAYPRDVVAETVAACRRHGVRLIAYVSICFDNYSVGLHRDWQATDVRGRARVTGPFTWLCLRSPYRDVMLAQIEELARGYDIDGLWMDIMPIAWPSAYTTTAIGGDARLWMLHDVVPCYCHACRTQFLEETGRALPLVLGDNDAQDVFAFGVVGVRRFIEEARSVLRRHRPDALLTYNGAGAPGDAIDAADIVSIEGHAPYYDRQDLIGRWARGRGQSFEVLSAGALPTSPGGWNGLDRKPETVLRLESAVTAAHGGSTVFGHAPFGSGRSDPGQLDGVGSVAAWLADAESTVTHPRSVAEVLLGTTIKSLDAPATWGRSLEGIEFWSAVLRGGHMLYDIGGLDRDLSAYRLLVLPDQLAMTDDEVDAVREYVHAGGALLATGETSRFDGRGRQRPDFALADVFGVSTGGRSGHPITYLTRIDPIVADGLPRTPIVINRESQRLTVRDGRPIVHGSRPERPFTDGSTVLWGYPSPDPAAESVLGTAREVGAGRVVYIGVPLDGEAPADRAWGTGGLESAWTKRLAENLVRSLLPEPIVVTDAPPGVEMVLNSHAGYWVLHLINHQAGDPGHLALSSPGLTLGPIRIGLDSTRVPAQRIERQDGRAARSERSGTRIETTVDGLGINDYFVLRPGDDGTAGVVEAAGRAGGGLLDG